MKITDVKTTVLVRPHEITVGNATRPMPSRDVLLAEVFTDEGATGLGYITGSGAAGGSEIFVIQSIVDKALVGMAKGEDPFCVEKLWDKMFRLTRRYGRKGAAVRAISVVDIALWDLIGKVTNQPLYKLLGGFREEVPVYGSGGLYMGGQGIDGLVKEAETYISFGVNDYKMKVGNPDVAEDTRRVAAVRDALGPNGKLMLDANQAWDAGTALQIARKWEKYDITWLEEPVAADDIPGYIKLSRSCPIPVAGGEEEYTRWGFTELISKGALDVCQADAGRCGGVTEWMKIAAIASAWNIPMAPHAIPELHIHLAAAVANGLVVEWFYPGHQIQKFVAELFDEPVEAKETKNGMMKVPQKPGLGIVINKKVYEKYKVS